MLNLIAVLTPNKKADIKNARAEKTVDILILIGKRPKPANAKQ